MSKIDETIHNIVKKIFEILKNIKSTILSLVPQQIAQQHDNPATILQNSSNWIPTYKEFSTPKEDVYSYETVSYLNLYEDCYQTLFTWISYEKGSSFHNNYSQEHKFHISINRKKANMNKAFSIIFPILLHYKICNFKILPQQHLSVYQEDNTVGKEFVIYIQTDDENEGKIEFWQQVLKEIVDRLSQAGVQPGPPSTGDIPIPGGEGFIYTRVTNNVFKNYIEAQFLKDNGFTPLEAALISSSIWSQIVIGDTKSKIDKIDPNNNHPKISLTLDETLQKDPLFNQLKEKILFSYKQDLNGEENAEGNLKMTPFYILIAGRDLYRSYLSADDGPFIQYFFKLSQKGQDYMTKKCYNFSHFKLPDTFLQEQLEAAAQTTAKILLSSKIVSREEDLQNLQVGNILPAIYYHFLVPLQKQFSSEKTPDLNQLVPTFLTTAGESLILNTILCSLRQRGCQHEHDEPTYIQGLKFESSSKN